MSRRKPRPADVDDLCELGPAAARGDLPAVLAILQAHPEWADYCEDYDDRTPLIEAAAAGHLPVVRALLDAGADPDGESWSTSHGDYDDDGPATALSLALANGHDAVAELMTLRTGAVLRQKAILTRRPSSPDNPKAQAALWTAVRVDSVERVRAAVAAGADVNRPERCGSVPLHRVRSGAVGLALLDLGADPTRADNDGETILQAVSTSGLAAVAERVIAGHRPGPAAKTTAVSATRPKRTRKPATAIDPQTLIEAVHAAVAAGRPECLAVLAAAGADLRAVNRGRRPSPAAVAPKYTPERLARRAGHAAVVAELVRLGAADGRVDELAAAAGKGGTEAVRRLLANGVAADSWVMVKGVEQTPLHLAATAGRTAAAELLLAAGADSLAKTECPSDTRRGDLTPLALAAAGGHAGVVRAVVAGGNPFLEWHLHNPFPRENPLFLAAEGGHLEVVGALLPVGPVWKVKDVLGRTAEQVAKAAGHLAVAERLRRARLGR